MSPKRGTPARLTPLQLRGWREAHGYGLRPLARALGVSPSTVLRWERGEVPLPKWLDAALRGLGRAS